MITADDLKVARFEGVTITSFGYARRNEYAQLSIDLRKLIDPPDWRIDSKSDDFQNFLRQKYPLVIDGLTQTIEALAKEIPYLTVAIGCSYGQHRSVAMAEILGKELKVTSKIVHRDWKAPRG